MATGGTASSEAEARPRRGRPPAFDRSVALDRLLTLFRRQGYDAATQEAMLEATGLSSSSLYRTFGTKHDTFLAALTRYLELTDAILCPLEKGTAGRADLEGFLDRVQAQFAPGDAPAGCLVVTTLCDRINDDPDVAQLTQRHLLRMEAAIRGTVARARRRGEALPLRADELASAILAGVLGATARATADPEGAERMLGGVRALVRKIG